MIQYDELRTTTLRSIFAGCYVVSICFCIEYYVFIFSELGLVIAVTVLLLLFESEYTIRYECVPKVI